MNPLLSSAFPRFVSSGRRGQIEASAHDGLPEVLPDRLAHKAEIPHADDYSLVQVRDEDTLAAPTEKFRDW